MKSNLGTFFGLSCWCMGAVVLALCAFTPASRADVIVNNTGTPFASFNGNVQYAQAFTMPGTIGDPSSLISSLALELNVSVIGSENVYLYSVNGSHVPTGTGTLLGTVNPGSTGDGLVTPVISLPGNISLAAGTSYAIALNTSGTIAWDVSSSSTSGGTGTLLGNYNSLNNGSTWSTGPGGFYLQMDLNATPVPEVPMTGMVMGFGVLAVAVGGTLRRKLRPAVSSIA
jgi:hypothetical protein